MIDTIVILRILGQKHQQEQCYWHGCCSDTEHILDSGWQQQQQLRLKAPEMHAAVRSTVYLPCMLLFRESTFFFLMLTRNKVILQQMTGTSAFSAAANICVYMSLQH